MEDMKPISIEDAYAVYDEEPTAGEVESNRITLDEALEVLRMLEAKKTDE